MVMMENVFLCLIVPDTSGLCSLLCIQDFPLNSLFRGIRKHNIKSFLKGSRLLMRIRRQFGAPISPGFISVLPIFAARKTLLNDNENIFPQNYPIIIRGDVYTDLFLRHSIRAYNYYPHQLCCIHLHIVGAVYRQMSCIL